MVVAKAIAGGGLLVLCLLLLHRGLYVARCVGVYMRGRPLLDLLAKTFVPAETAPPRGFVIPQVCGVVAVVLAMAGVLVSVGGFLLGRVLVMHFLNDLLRAGRHHRTLTLTRFYRSLI